MHSPCGATLMYIRMEHDPMTRCLRMRRSSWAVPIDMLRLWLPIPPSHATSFRSDQTIEPIRTSVGASGRQDCQIGVNHLALQQWVRCDYCQKATFTTFLLLNTWCAVRAILGRHPDGQQYSVNNSTVKPGRGVDLALLQFTSNQTYQVATLANYSTEEDRWFCLWVA